MFDIFIFSYLGISIPQLSQSLESFPMIALQTDPPHGSTSSSPLCLEITPTAPISILFRQRYLHSRAYLTQRTRASKQEYLVFPAAKGVSSCSGLWFCISHLVKMFPTVPLTFPTRVHPPLPISQRVSTASLFLSEVLIQYTPIFAVVFFWSLRLES